ncbi:MAG TPA: VWA domain-containing protein, partial [Blastocatellia bacterium]|nr:VWA domain-containing protein [Blastocatellia bacterium]
MRRIIQLCSMVYVSVLMMAVASQEFAAFALTKPSQDQQKPTAEEPVRLSASLVQVPAVVTDRSGKFVSDLSRNDFTVSEDGKRQDISFFAATKQPFNAVLVLDTSNSAQDRLRVIQSAAVDFTKQLRPGDRMMAISFDNEVRQLTDFSQDRRELEKAIRGTESGFGKLLYEAVARALEQLKNVEGRRAVVLFSDGVDMRSVEASSEGTTRMAEEVGAMIFVVRFDTRWWIEADARRQGIEHPKSKTPFDIDGRIPLPPDFGGPDPLPTGIPKPNAPRIEIGPRPRPPVVYVPDGTGTRTQRLPSAEPPDQITSTLDKLYGEADSYLQTITTRSGGRVYLADTFDDTTAAFAAIAEELRNQYLIGYYSTSNKRDGKYRKIKLELARKGVEV